MQTRSVFVGFGQAELSTFRKTLAHKIQINFESIEIWINLLSGSLHNTIVVGKSTVTANLAGVDDRTDLLPRVGSCDVASCWWKHRTSRIGQCLGNLVAFCLDSFV